MSKISRARYRLHKRRNKFNAKPTEYRGVRYDSKMEAEYAESLDADPAILWWLRQVNFDLTEDHRYRVDFLVAKTNGSIYAIEVKGRVTPQANKHFKLWRKYGIMPLHVVYKNKLVVIDDGLAEIE